VTVICEYPLSGLLAGSRFGTAECFLQDFSQGGIGDGDAAAITFEAKCT